MCLRNLTQIFLGYISEKCIKSNFRMYKREKNIKVLIIWRGPSPYRVDFFNELGKLCDLTVLFERRPDQITDKRKNHGFMKISLTLKEYT